MRERLIAAFIGLAAVAVCLYAVPRSFVISNLIRTQEQHRIDDTARVLAPLIDSNASRVSTAFLNSVNGESEWIQVRRGSAVVATTAAQHGGGPHDLVATRPLAGGGTVTVGLSDDAVSDAISDALLPLIMLGLGIVGLAGIAGFIVAVRFGRPLQELADAAEGLGQGELDPDLPRYRIRELRAIGAGLTSSGGQIEAMLEHERKLAVHASHELRTPIAALRLELEDLALWRETPPTVRAQLEHATGELDRLSAAVGDLLELSHARRAQSETDADLGTLIAEAVRHPSLAGRVVHVPGVKVSLRVEPAATTRVIRELALAMLARGVSQVNVTVVRRPTRVEISFQPTGKVPVHEVPAATSELTSAIGGRITPEGLGLVLRLPIHEPVPVVAAD